MHRAISVEGRITSTSTVVAGLRASSAIIKSLVSWLKCMHAREHFGVPKKEK